MLVHEFAPTFLPLEERRAQEGMGSFAGGIIANAILLLVLIFGKSTESATPLQRSATRILLVAPNVVTPELVTPKALTKRALTDALPKLLERQMIAARAKPRKATFELPEQVKSPHSVAPMVEAPLLRAATAIPLATSLPLPVAAPILAPPKPVIGSFSEASAQVSSKKLEQSTKLVAEVGGFSSASESRTKRGAATGVPAQVSDSGFGALKAEARGATQRGSSGVVSAGFDTSTLAPLRERKSVNAAVDINMKAVEILGKPRPLYTEEARRLRIEGEVLLRILFGADGKLKVQAVISGLGHGLDESAVLSATQIQFRPATQNGQAVDQTATVRVRFQLAE